MSKTKNNAYFPKFKSMKTKHVRCLQRGTFFILALMLAASVFAQNVPELIYYKFDAAGTTVANEASSPVGLNPATVNGLTIGGTGQFGMGLLGNGGSSTTNYVNTGWNTNLGNSPWTISFYINGAANNTTLYYLWGNNTANSFRCFIGGAAGAGNAIIRGGGLPDLIIPAIAPGPTVIHFVFDGTTIKGYKNGVLGPSASATAVNIVGSAPFKVGGYSTSIGMNAGCIMDEFRIYNRALTADEISQTWDQTLPLGGGTSLITIEIGTGTNTSYRVPWNHFYQYSRTQTIYKQSEINTAGQIQKIYYHAANWPASYTYTQLKIWMGTTTLPSWTATTQWIDNATLTLVYDGPITITGPGWIEIPLQTPFNYDNVGNLVISIHEPLNVPSYAGSSYTFYYSTTGTNRYLLGYSDSQQWPTSLSMYDYLPNIKMDILIGGGGTLAGVVTNASTGAPVVGAKIQAGDSITYSGLDGSYSMPLPPFTIPSVTCSKLGYDAITVTDVEINSGEITVQDFALQENTNPPSVVYASLNTGQTAVNITWGLPQGPYEIVYDDGHFENMTAWAVEGNINALKFTPINSYPVQILGGKVHIGDGSYPTGTDLQSFTMAVYDDDGTMGLPNTELTSVEVTPTHYGWVEFTFPTPVTITSGDFYIGMIQGGNYPNCVPIAIDETNPSMRSYSRFVTGNGPWVPAGYNDFMIRADVMGAGGPLDLTTGNQPGQFIEKRRENKGTYSLKIPRLIGGQEGVASYIPIPQNGDNSDVIVGYQVWRLKQGEETNPSVWVSIGTPTSTSLVDNGWPTLPNGPYRWAVKAKYTGDRWSDAAFSNVIGKGWTANVTFNITMCSSSASPEGTMVKLTNTQYPDTAYFAVAPANGIVTFPQVWKGNYDIWVFKFTFTEWTLNDDINGDKTYNVNLIENLYPPKNMFVDDRSLLASWNAAHLDLLVFEETWNSGSFTTQGWTRSGGTNWGIATGFGNPAPSAQFNWSPSVTNYDQSLISPNITGIGSPGLNLKYDIYLSNYGTTTLEELAVEIWDGTAWDRLAYYNNAQGDIPWTSETKNIDSYSFSTFKIRFRAYGQDSYNINNWNIDNIRVVGVAKSGKDLLGYNVYLNDIQIGFTSDTTYQIPQNLCTYGQTYTACVEAAYECGVSTNSCYTFTAHYLPAPRNLEATPIQDAAYLTWEYPVMGSKLEVLDLSPRTSMPNPTYEYSPMVANQQMINATEAIWDVLFTFNAAGASRPGVETDGTYIYTAQWNGANFGKFENQGGTWTLVTEFTIAGASSIRDLAYDGTYFYGGSASTTIYKMDFNTQTLVGTISTSGVNVRHIAYDPANEGFWTGDWTTMALVSMTGATIQTVNTGLSGMYGDAYDDQSIDGPYLWIFDQGGSGVDILQMDIATTTLTGVVHAATDIPGFASGDIAGGLASDNANLVAGKFILLVNIQHDPNIIGAYEIAESTGGGGAAPSNLLGYNVYRDGTLISYVEKPTTEYYDLYLDPGHYCYNVTAVYDLEPYGFPAGSTAESVEEGPACIDIDYGFPIPWSEDWATSSFSTNSWSLNPDPSHWKISTMTGNPVPSAEFTWAPPVTDYSFALETPNLTAGLFTCADIWLDFDLKLDDRNQTGDELLQVDIWKNGNWSNVAEFSNEGSFNWENQHIDISNLRGKAFKVRFVATGSNSADILGWFIDNINIYPVVYPALNLTAQNNNLDYNIYLQWNSPDCPSVGTGTIMQYIFDDGTIENGWAINPGYSVWLGNEFPVTDAGVLQSFDLYFMNNSAAGPYQMTIDIFDANQQLVGSSDVFIPQPDAWITVPINDVPFDGTFYAMVHWNMLPGNTHWFGVDENGPYAYLDLEWYYDGSAWDKLTNLAGATPCVFAMRATALVGDDKKVVTYGTPREFNPQPVESSPALISANISSPIDAGHHFSSRAIPLQPGKGVIGYNVYRNGELITPTPITDTTLVDVVDTNATYCYVVKAVHEGYNSTTIESAASNEACPILTVGLVDNQLASLKVYPNPAKDVVNVETTKDIRTIEMINYLGQSVYKQAVDGKGVYKINTRQLESGVYFIRFIDAKGIVTTERVTITK